MSSYYLLLGTAAALGGFSIRNDVENILIWERADEHVETPVSNHVGTWGDPVYTREANSIDAKRPLLVTIGGNPAVLFNGIDQFLEGESDITVQGTFAEWVFLANDDTTGASILTEHHTGAASLDFLFLNGAVDKPEIFFKRSALTSRRTSVSTVPSLFDGNEVLLRAQYGGSHAEHRAHLDTVEIPTETQIDSDNPSGSATDRTFLGMRNGLTLPFTGPIRERLRVSPIPPAEQLPLIGAEILNRWS